MWSRPWQYDTHTHTFRVSQGSSLPRHSSCQASLKEQNPDHNHPPTLTVAKQLEQTIVGVQCMFHQPIKAQYCYSYGRRSSVIKSHRHQHPLPQHAEVTRKPTSINRGQHCPNDNGLLNQKEPIRTQYRWQLSPLLVPGP